MEEREGRLWFLFQFLHDVEEEMSKEEQKQVMIEKAINLRMVRRERQPCARKNMPQSGNCGLHDGDLQLGIPGIYEMGG